MPSDSERKAVKTIPLMTCTNKDCSCTGMDFCNVLPECANCGACGMPLSIKKRSPKPNNRNPSHAVTTVLDDLASATARIAELEAMVRELLNNWFISGEAREKALALLNQEERKP